MISAAHGNDPPAGASNAVPPASPLGLLHPDGWARDVSVCGTSAATALAPATHSAGSPADLVLLVPSREERRKPDWMRAAREAAANLAADGLVVAPAPSRRLRAELLALGLAPSGRLLHAPDVPRSRYVFPLHGPAARYALRHVVPLHGLKRIAARALAVPGAGALGPTSWVFRRPGARPLLEWLSELTPSSGSSTAILAQSWRPGGATVIYRFGSDAAPDAVAKVGRGAVDESRALRAVGADARVMSVGVPALLGEGMVGGRPFALEAPVAGSPAPATLRGSPDRMRALLRAVAGWLAEWNATTAVRRTFERADAERHLLAAARGLASPLGDDGTYLSRLERLCDRCIGAEVPFVAAHNDLTAANILVSEHRAFGVVDWEEAANDCLPLGDLAYAVADFAAALHGYSDRPAAYDACFEPGGAFADYAGELLGNAASSQRIDAAAKELCFQACWLHHAEDERRDAGAGGAHERPFLAILKRAATRLAA